jgi:hypothetical protein
MEMFLGYLNLQFHSRHAGVLRRRSLVQLCGISELLWCLSDLGKESVLVSALVGG